MANTDLNIRVINNARASQTVMLYQQDQQLNVENYHISAWSVTPLAVGAQHDLVLPFAIQVQGRESADIGAVRTAIRRTDYNKTWNLIEDSVGALDITQADGAPSPGANSVNIVNTIRTEYKTGVALKDGVPLFASDLPPGQRVNFQVMPKLHVALSRDYKEGKLYRAVTLSPTTSISFIGQTAVIIEIKEDLNGLIEVTHQFTSQIPRFQPVARAAQLAA